MRDRLYIPSILTAGCLIALAGFGVWFLVQKHSESGWRSRTPLQAPAPTTASPLTSDPTLSHKAFSKADELAMLYKQALSEISRFENEGLQTPPTQNLSTSSLPPLQTQPMAASYQAHSFPTQQPLQTSPSGYVVTDKPTSVFRNYTNPYLQWSRSIRLPY